MDVGEPLKLLPLNCVPGRTGGNIERAVVLTLHKKAVLYLFGQTSILGKWNSTGGEGVATPLKVLASWLLEGGGLLSCKGYK